MKKSLASTYGNVRSTYYKKYLKFSKEKVRANAPEYLKQDKWESLCDLYKTKGWEVNILKTKMLIILNTNILMSSLL